MWTTFGRRSWPTFRRRLTTTSPRSKCHRPQQPLKLRALGMCARELVAEYLFAPRRLQRGKLVAEVLANRLDNGAHVRCGKIVALIQQRRVHSFGERIGRAIAEI